MQSDVLGDRIALDETSFDFRGLDSSRLEEHLDLLNEVLSELRQQGHSVRAHPWLWTDVNCLDGLNVCDFVFQPRATEVSPDTLRLLGMMLDRCDTWSGEEDAAIEAVTISPSESDESGHTATPVRLDPPFSVGIALAHDRVTACLVFGGAIRRGWWSAQEYPQHGTYFFAEPTELTHFWRSLYSRAQVSEHDYFTLAPYAFPSLLLHPDLDFRRFDGTYLAMRDEVTQILGVINDHFGTAMTSESGIPHQVGARLGQFGVELSPESPATRGSASRMRLREVTLDGTVYLCEWHAKVEPHRNRIHFSLPQQELDGRIVVGIFAEHLPT